MLFHKKAMEKSIFIEKILQKSHERLEIWLKILTKMNFQMIDIDMQRILYIYIPEMASLFALETGISI